MLAATLFAAGEASSIPFGGPSPLIKRYLWKQTKRPEAASELASLSNYNSKSNPFLDMVTTEQQKFMPFLNFSSATTGNSNQDFFGFRNPSNAAYLDRDTPLIVLTGNSEAVGIHHPQPINELLQLELARRGLKYAVVNMAMNSYTIPMEIEAYVSIADKLCPTLVISHSTPEYPYGSVAEPMFRRFGLGYLPALKEWAYRMYYLRDGSDYLKQHLEPPTRGTAMEVAQSTLRNIMQYSQIVQRNRTARFLLGIQIYGEIPNVDQAELLKFKALLKAFVQQTSLDFIDFEKIEGLHLVDFIHTDAASAAIIARVYADWIEKNIGQSHTPRDQPHCVFAGTSVSP